MKSHNPGDPDPNEDVTMPSLTAQALAALHEIRLEVELSILAIERRFNGDPNDDTNPVATG